MKKIPSDTHEGASNNKHFMPFVLLKFFPGNVQNVESNLYYSIMKVSIISDNFYALGWRRGSGNEK